MRCCWVDACLLLFFVLDGFVLFFFVFGRKGMLRMVFILKWGFARSFFLVAGPLNPVLFSRVHFIMPHFFGGGIRQCKCMVIVETSHKIIVHCMGSCHIS